MNIRGSLSRRMVRAAAGCFVIFLVVSYFLEESETDYNMAALAMEEIPPEKVLMSELIPPNVHYMWCGDRWFQFKHYLSVLSVLKSVKPDNVFVHYEHSPGMDRLYYHQWMDNLKRDYPFLILEQMNRYMLQYCSTHFREKKVGIILRLLDMDGGIYIGESTWMLDFPTKKRLMDLELALEPDSMEGYIMMRAGIYSRNGNSYRSLVNAGDRLVKRSACGHVQHVYTVRDVFNRTGCLVVNGEPYDTFYPMDIWELDDPFGRLSRRLFYGTEAIRRPVPSFDELVPNIAHMVWLGGGHMDYVFYLSVLSLLYVAKVETVYIHGDVEPAGEYWQEIKGLKQTQGRLKFITRTQPLQIYQGPTLTQRKRALMSDFVRIDLMIKYGGIYTDTDAIWVKPLSETDRGYEAVASYDWIDWSWPYPDSVNFGISYGKRNAPFWRIFRESLRVMHLDIHGFSGVMMPYKLLEKFPHLLRIDRHLQVICYHSKCHPTWVEDYHNMSKNHVNMNSIPNWRENVHAFHWTFPNPSELQSRSTMLNSKGIFAELGQNVLRLAGLL